MTLYTTATSIACPRCKSGPGMPCVATIFSPLVDRSIHRERSETAAAITRQANREARKL